jgi:hypothetical protein
MFPAKCIVNSELKFLFTRIQSALLDQNFSIFLLYLKNLSMLIRVEKIILSRNELIVYALCKIDSFFVTSNLFKRRVESVETNDIEMSTNNNE